MNKLALFLSGVFAGGAADHLILVMLGSNRTPFGIRTTILGNVALAALDALIAGALFYAHRRLSRPA